MIMLMIMIMPIRESDLQILKIIQMTILMSMIMFVSRIMLMSIIMLMLMIMLMSMIILMSIIILLLMILSILIREPASQITLLTLMIIRETASQMKKIRKKKKNNDSDNNDDGDNFIYLFGEKHPWVKPIREAVRGPRAKPLPSITHSSWGNKDFAPYTNKISINVNGNLQ